MLIYAIKNKLKNNLLIFFLNLLKNKNHRKIKKLKDDKIKKIINFINYFK